MQPHPFQNLPWYSLSSSKNIWCKSSVAYFTKWFQSIFTVGGRRMYPFNLLCCPLPTYPHRVVKAPHLEAWTRPEPEVTSLNPARAWHLFLKPDLGLKAKFTERVLRYAQLRVTENVVCRCSCRYMVYHTQNSNHLDQNMGIIWHKHSMLVNDNTAECGVCFSR